MTYKKAWAVAALMLGGTIGTLMCQGCQRHEGSEEQLKEYADSFSTLYFNWHFEQASHFATPESEPWLRFAASNVHPADIDSLRAKAADATISIEDIDFHNDETSATVTLQVSDFLQMDSIGEVPHSIGNATFLLPMQIHEGKWKVALQGLFLDKK